MAKSAAEHLRDFDIDLSITMEEIPNEDVALLLATDMAFRAKQLRMAVDIGNRAIKPEVLNVCKRSEVYFRSLKEKFGIPVIDDLIATMHQRVQSLS